MPISNWNSTASFPENTVNTLPQLFEAGAVFTATFTFTNQSSPRMAAP